MCLKQCVCVFVTVYCVFITACLCVYRVIKAALGIAGVAVAGGAAVSVGIPAALGFAGFTAAGITKGA